MKKEMANEPITLTIHKNRNIIPIDKSVILNPGINPKTKLVYAYITCLSDEELESINEMDLADILEMDPSDIFYSLSLLNQMEIIKWEV